jgi:hypothetical protein
MVDAFEKRYLKSVAFCLYKSENNEDKVLESYQVERSQDLFDTYCSWQFGFEYPDSDRATLNGAEITRDNLRQQVCNHTTVKPTSLSVPLGDKIYALFD